MNSKITRQQHNNSNDRKQKDREMETKQRLENAQNNCCKKH